MPMCEKLKNKFYPYSKLIKILSTVDKERNKLFLVKSFL